MARFEFRKHLLGAINTVTLPFVIANSVTVTKGGAVYIDGDGYAIPCTAGSLVAGIVMAITDKNGIDLGNTSETLDGTYTAQSGSTNGSYLSADDNETVLKITVHVAVDPYAMYKNDADGSLSQGDVLQFGNLISAYQLDATDFDSPTGGQFQCMALDPDSESDDSMGLFRIAESQLFPYAQR